MKLRRHPARLSQPTNQQGYSLIEVLAAIAILMVIAMASSTVSVHMKDSYWISQRRVAALNLAEAMTEELLLRAKTDPSLAAGTHTRHFDRYGVAATGPDLFEVVWTVTPDQPKTDMFELHVRVNWKDLDRPHSVALMTARSFNP